MSEGCKAIHRKAGPDSFARGSGGSSGLLILLAVTFLAFINYAALLPAVPLWAASGGAGSIAVGATTGVMMSATVATQLAMPWLFQHLSLRTMMLLGTVLLGAPTAFYALSPKIGPIALITVIRGAGFACVVTAGATLIADIAGRGRLAASASYYGIAAALPNLGALAGGVWIAGTWGFLAVFLSAAAASLLGGVLAWKLPAEPRGTFRLGSLHDVRGIAVPVGLFVLTAGSFGAMTSFLPLSGPDAETAAFALLAASVALVGARFAAGRTGDRYGPGRLLIPAVLSGAAGCLLIATSLEGPAWVLFIGASLLGAGFGACQNDSFVITVQRLGAARSGTASTLWNIAYDGGLGLGAFGFGWVIGQLGYPGAFLAVGTGMAVAIAALLCARGRVHRRRRRRPARLCACSTL